MVTPWLFLVEPGNVVLVVLVDAVVTAALDVCELPIEVISKFIGLLLVCLTSSVTITSNNNVVSKGAISLAINTCSI